MNFTMEKREQMEYNESITDKGEKRIWKYMY